MEDIAGEALRMDAYQRRQRALGDFAHPENRGFCHAILRETFESVDAKVSKPGWKIRFGDLAQPERGRYMHQLPMCRSDASIIMICELTWRNPIWSRCW